MNDEREVSTHVLNLLAAEAVHEYKRRCDAEDLATREMRPEDPTTRGILQQCREDTESARAKRDQLGGASWLVGVLHEIAKSPSRYRAILTPDGGLRLELGDQPTSVLSELKPIPSEILQQLYDPSSPQRAAFTSLFLQKFS